MIAGTKAADRCLVEAQARIRKKSQITIPQEILDKLGIGPGDTIVFCIREGNPKVAQLRPLPRSFSGLLTGVYGKTQEEIEDYLREERDAWENG